MAAPASYSESGLAAFMAAELGTSTGTVGADLSPTVALLESAVWDVLARYGVAAIASATNIPKLQAIARARVWAWAVDRYVTRYRDTVDSESMDRQQLYDHAKERAEYWQQQAVIVSGLTVGSGTPPRPTFFSVASGCRGR